MKPRCRSIQPYLSDYIDCTLSGRQTVVVAQHLRACKTCQLEVESLKRTKQLLHFYVSPDPPEGYHDQFRQQLQQTIENRAHPMWGRTTGLWYAFIWRCENDLNRLVRVLGTFISPPVDWMKSSPVYAWLLFVSVASLLLYPFLLLPQEQNSGRSANLRYALKVYPMSPVKVEENRQLIRNYERPARTAHSFPEQLAQENQRLDWRLDSVESSTGVLEWDGYLSSFVNDSDALKAAIPCDISSDSITVAQLSSPDAILTTDNFSLPLGVVIKPFPKIDWEGNRSSNGFVDLLMNVPLRSLSISKVYDSVKL